VIRELADKEWPDSGWEHLPTNQIRAGLSKKIEATGLNVPSLDTFDRALGRRED
jgi:hypothetical protein